MDGGTFELRDGGNNIVPAGVTYDVATRTAVLVPDAPLAPTSVYTATVVGGPGGVADVNVERREVPDERLTILARDDGLSAFSPRIKFGAMLSNYAQTTNVRLNGIDPQKEQATAPLLISRIREAAHMDLLLAPGEVLLPEALRMTPL